jgi:hypothetical protein
MFKLYNFTCLNIECNNHFEELMSPDEVAPQCSVCGSDSQQQLFSFDPTVEQNVHWTEVMQKGKNIRNKLQGKVPWRKSSESQSD